MNSSRKSLCQGRILRNPLELAKDGRLTAAEVAEPIACLRIAARALREGVATEWERIVVASALNVAQAIERLGVVRGLSGRLHAAEMALQGIYQRAMCAGIWRCTSLYYQELEDITSMVDLHEFQFGQVSYCEFRRAVHLVKTHVTSQPRASQEIS